jgi:hypothetical protein
MLIGPLGIEDGSVYNVALVLSSTGDVVTSLTVESLWYSETGTGEQYWVGFQVLAVSEDCCESFESLVSKFEP